MSEAYDKVIKRPVQSSDFGLLMDSWPKGIWYATIHDIRTTKADWFKEFYKYAKQSFLNDEILIACLESTPDFVVGYAIISKDPKCLEWVYVKESYRRQGIGGLLLKGQRLEGINDMNLTRIGQQLLPKLSTKETA